MITDEEVVWRWLSMSLERRASVTRKMLTDGRLILDNHLNILPGDALWACVCRRCGNPINLSSCDQCGSPGFGE